MRGWQRVRSFPLRLTHLLLIGYIVVNTLLGNYCPLTVWENQLRRQGQGVTYSGDFIAHWLHDMLYIDAPKWVFTVCYTIFGLCVLLLWLLYPPTRIRLWKAQEHQHRKNHPHTCL